MRLLWKVVIKTGTNRVKRHCQFLQGAVLNDLTGGITNPHAAAHGINSLNFPDERRCTRTFPVIAPIAKG